MVVCFSVERRKGVLFLVVEVLNGDRWVGVNWRVSRGEMVGFWEDSLGVFEEELVSCCGAVGLTRRHVGCLESWVLMVDVEDGYARRTEGVAAEKNCRIINC